MLGLSFDYWNKLAEQLIFISSLLGGFSIAVVANIIVSGMNTRFKKSILLSASFFLITLFAMTKLFMMT